MSSHSSSAGAILQIWLADPDACDVVVRILPEHIDGNGIHGTAAYFASSLREPWRTHGDIERELILRCPALTTPWDVCFCLKLLKPEHEDQKDAEYWTVDSVDSVLKVLSVANYLGYDECTDLCMKYLAAAFDSMEMKPPADVWAKLQPIEQADSVLKYMLAACAMESCELLLKFVKHGCSTSPKIQRMCKYVLAELSASTMARAIAEQHDPENIALWSAYTWTILTLYEDVAPIVRMFLSRCEEFCNAMRNTIAWFPTKSMIQNTVGLCLAEMLERVIPNRSGKPKSFLMDSKAFLLTNLERRRLATAIFSSSTILCLPHPSSS